ncbi:MAG: thiamine-phosphate pyrophosphorylase [Candidatus Omnitrophica bacterium]|nr:thiamine-phosphate pyrophosphorylase [Candidatus Omnitrophota bacterium]
MRKTSKIKGIDRIIDANLNRLKEGLRVLEEICRFIIDSRELTLQFKKTRHKINAIAGRLNAQTELIEERASLEDVGRLMHHKKELERKNCQDIFFANSTRVKESLRVLEEFSKLKDIRIALEFKKIRYGIYELEKKSAKRLPALRNT